MKGRIPWRESQTPRNGSAVRRHRQDEDGAQSVGVLSLPPATARGVTVAIWVALALDVGRFVQAGVSPLNAIPAWFNEELPGLVGWLVEGRPILQIDPRQYGPVVFLALDPAIRLLAPGLGTDPFDGVIGTRTLGLSVWALVLSLAGSVAGLVFFGLRFLPRRPLPWAVAGIGWFSFTPLVYVVAQRSVDAWQLAFLCLSLYLSTGSERQRRFAGVPLAFAALTKILPAFLLAFLFLRDRTAALIGAAAGLVILAIGQVLYGPMLGFWYPIAILSQGGSTIATWSTHFENISLRGLIFKIGTVFRLQPDRIAYALDPSLAPVLNVVAYVGAAVLAVYTLSVGWRSRADPRWTRRALGFALAITTMLLISPHAAQDYTAAMLPVFGVLAVLLLAGQPKPWPWRWRLAAVASAFLVGVFLPASLVASLLRLDALMALAGNAGNRFVADYLGNGIGVYQLLGFPGYGLLIAWGLVAVLEARVARQRPNTERAVSHAPTSAGAAMIPSHGPSMAR